VTPVQLRRRFLLSTTAGTKGDASEGELPMSNYIVRTTADAIGHGTLRSGILYANAHPGTTISFASDLAHHTITLNSAAA
jgi:hypothetical protein